MTHPSPSAASRLPPGTLLRLNAQDWRYGRGCATGQPVELVVTGLRHDLTRFYGGREIWVEGHTPTCRPDHRPCRQLLVRTAAVPQLEITGGATIGGRS
jgi:hypothetical protein